jgi:23S rRNA pseudouridine1911/1915/1917 synthase
MVKSSAKTGARAWDVQNRARIDGFLRGKLGLSWGRARALVERGKVFVDGQRVLESSAELGPGQSVEVREAAPRPRAGNVPDDLVVHADAHVVVVRKPAGVSTVPYGSGGPKERGTLDEMVRRALDARSLGVVHRLDKETSGLVVFTRTWLAKKSLSSQFRAHTVERRYLAIAHGRVPKRTITSHLVADRGDGLRGSIERMRARGSVGGGQRAVTHVEPIETRTLHGAPATLVSCRLETGRTHQIRIHLAEMGHPLVGERVYVRDYDQPRIEAPRVMLHAAVLGFVHPKTERPVRWEEPPPADFEATWARAVKE